MLHTNSSNSNIPLDEPKFKGDNFFSIVSSSDASESSTGDSNINNLENQKSKEEVIIPNKLNKKKRKGKKNEKILNKKIKRNNSRYNTKKNNLINIIFNEFKSSSISLYKKFPEFNIIEKNIKNELYNTYFDFVTDMRNIFSNIFLSFSKKLDNSKYNQVLILSEIFEKIYKKYDCDSIAKKAQNLFDVMNKLKKEIHKYEIAKNGKIGKNNVSPNFGNNENLMKKYKENISNKINKLNVMQKKGILKIISNNLLDKNNNNGIVEFNINKIPFHQLKMLDKYINECINNNIFEQIRKNSEISSGETIEEKRENVIIEEDEYASSCFSDDDFEDDDLV